MRKLLKKLIIPAIVLVAVLAAGLNAFALEGPPQEEESVSSSSVGSPAEDTESSLPQDTSAPQTPTDAEEITQGATDNSPEAGDADASVPTSADAEEESSSAAAQPPANGSDEEEEPGNIATEAYGLALSDDSIVVSTYEELSRALAEDNGYTTIYLGADIAASGSGVSIHPNKAHVVIDGSPPSGGRFTFTQYAASGLNLLLRVDNTATTTESVTLRNIDIAGANIYGVVSVSDALQSRVSLVFENVSYAGPQAVYHRGGSVRFAGGSYQLTTGELAEALHVQFAGEVSVEAPNTSNAILWLTSTASTVVVEEGANVSINTSSYFVYGSIAGATIQPNASFSLTSKRFGFSYAADSVRSFTVAEGGSLYISLNTSESYAALRVAQSFEMAPGSSATILRTGTSGIPLRLTAAGATAVFNQPQRVFLYSSAGVPLRFTGSGTLNITTTALNVWQKASWPLAGGVDTQPTHIWNKANSEALRLTGSYNETLNRSLEHNLTEDDPVTFALNAESFNLEKSQLVVFGRGVLDIDIPTTSRPALTGGANPGAQLLAGYILADGRGGTIAGTSDTSGRYALPVSGGALQVGSQVEIVSNASGLFLRRWATVQQGGLQTLSFASVPGQIHFGSLPVPNAHQLGTRQGTPLAITVLDTRQNPAPWRISASLARPLSATVAGGKTQLPGSVVFVTSDKETLVLNEVPQTIYQNTGGHGGTLELNWAQDEGVLLSLAPGEIYSNVEYTATIHWALVDAP